MGVESCTCEDTNHVTFRVPAAEFARFASPLRSRQVTSHHIADTAAIEGTLPSHPPLYLLIPPAQQTNAPDAPTSFWASFPPPPAPFPPALPLCARRPITHPNPPARATAPSTQASNKRAFPQRSASRDYAEPDLTRSPRGPSPSRIDALHPSTRFSLAQVTRDLTPGGPPRKGTGRP